MQFYFHANQSHFHNNGLAFRLDLKSKMYERFSALASIVVSSAAVFQNTSIAYS